MSLDIYVPPYIPKWILDVNAAEDVHHVHLPYDDAFHAESYVASFSGRDVWKESHLAAGSLEQLGHSVLNQHVKELLYLNDLENEALREQARGWARYEVRLELYHAGHGATHPGRPGTSFYQCHVHGIAEFTPRVLLGDLVELRQLVPSARTFDGTVLHARVSGVRRAKGEVILEAPTIIPHSMSFNLSFLHDEKATDAQRKVLRQVALQNNAWMTSHCFPEARHCRLKTQLTHVKDFIWRDKELNLEQMKAVQDICEHRYGDVPYLIQGPPGTGKTKTLVEAILQVLELNKNARIIACGASNTAADTLAIRLSKRLRDPQSMLRLNDSARTFEEVPESLLGYSYIEHDRFSVPSFEVLMSKRIIVATTAEIALLNAIQCSNQSIVRLQEYIARSLTSDRVRADINIHFSHLFLDEAAQATESESLCVLQVVAPPLDQRVCLVLAGDHRQLGPRITSGEARDRGMNCSFFERLIGRNCYVDHPLSRSKILSNPRPRLPFLYPAFTNLYRNYRSHAGILMIPSQLSYNSSLMACATDVDNVARRLQMPIPVAFIGHKTSEETADVQIITSWYNPAEIKLIVKQVEALVSSHPDLIRPSDIAVLAPFREQIVRLRIALRKAKLGSVGVGSVEDYQGAEAKIIIVSVVRTQQRFLANDRKTATGLMYEHRRMNVALTRAKELLIVVGNPSLMSSDEYWRTWLAFCKRNGTFQGEQFFANLSQDIVEPISSLERAFHFRSRDFPSLGRAAADDETSEKDDSMLLAGHAAQLVLDEAEY